MPVIVHCPPNTYAEKETYIYGTTVQVRKEWLSRLRWRFVYTVKVRASGGEKDEHWPELVYPVFVTATDTDHKLPSCRYYEIYEYLDRTTEPPPSPPPPEKESEKFYTGTTLEKINKHLHDLAKRREDMGCMDTYKLGVIESDWDE